MAALATLLDAFLRARSLELEISSRLLANRRDLERLVRHAEDDGHPLLEGWRRQVVGDDLLRLLRGELSLGVRQAHNGRSTVVVNEVPGHPVSEV